MVASFSFRELIRMQPGMGVSSARCQRTMVCSTVVAPAAFDMLGVFASTRGQSATASTGKACRVEGGYQKDETPVIEGLNRIFSAARFNPASRALFSPFDNCLIDRCSLTTKLLRCCSCRRWLVETNWELIFGAGDVGSPELGGSHGRSNHGSTMASSWTYFLGLSGWASLDHDVPVCSQFSLTVRLTHCFMTS